MSSWRSMVSRSARRCRAVVSRIAVSVSLAAGVGCAGGRSKWTFRGAQGGKQRLLLCCTGSRCQQWAQSHQAPSPALEKTWV
jgi:hypothetical protein